MIIDSDFEIVRRRGRRVTSLKRRTEVLSVNSGSLCGISFTVGSGVGLPSRVI